MQGRITKEFVMRPYVFTTQLRRIIIMKKRLIAVLMCAAMVTVLGAGCGSKKEDTKETSDTKKEYTVYEADEDAEYEQVVEINLAEVRPTVAFPHLPGNAKTIDEIEAMEPIKIDQVVIGSCTNGRIEDMRIAAEIMKGKKVADDVRCIVFPGTQAIYLEAIEKGYITDMVLAGAAISTPTCGPCLGGHMGILAAGERAVSTTNRNFVGRMGHTESEVYLASPAVAAASAITGKISSPSEVCGGEK